MRVNGINRSFQNATLNIFTANFSKNPANFSKKYIFTAIFSGILRQVQDEYAIDDGQVLIIEKNLFYF
jgi:hypothetical protein